MTFPIEEISMKPVSILMLILSLSLAASASLAGPAPEKGMPTQHGATSTGAYMGVFVEPLPPALKAQLPADVPEGQGVLVGRIEPGSPADNAGLRPFDLLLSYDDQKLFAPEQLVRLVAGDEPERTVKLQIARAGKLQTLELTLGEGKTREFTPLPHPMHPVPAYQMPPQAIPPRMSPPAGPISESFESLNIKSLDEGRFQVSIEYQDNAGKAQRHQYTGTREELHQQITQAEDLPPQARRQLLRALGMTGYRHMPGQAMPKVQGPFNYREMMHWWQQNYGPEPTQPQP
jgi:hypothetical protein